MASPTSLAPGYFRLTYSGELFPHHMTVPVNFDGTPVPGTEPDLILKDLSVLGATSVIGAFVDLIKPFFDTTTNFGLAEIHTVDATTGEDQFIYAFNVGDVGTAAGARVPMAQGVITFKTTIGSLYRLYLMESVYAPNDVFLPPYAPGLVADLVDYLTGDDSPVYGRQNAYPFAVLSFITKTNDKLRKQQGGG